MPRPVRSGGEGRLNARWFLTPVVLEVKVMDERVLRPWLSCTGRQVLVEGLPCTLAPDEVPGRGFRHQFRCDRPVVELLVAVRPPDPDGRRRAGATVGHLALGLANLAMNRPARVSWAVELWLTRVRG